MKLDEGEPLRAGHHRDDPRRLAVGHRQPLRLPQPGSEQRATRSPTAAASAATTPPRRSTSTSSSTRSTPRRAQGLQQIIRGSAANYDGRSVERAQEPQVPEPGAVLDLAGSTREIALDDKTFERFITDTATVVTRAGRAARRPGLRSSATPTPRRARSATRTSPWSDRWAAAGHAAQGEHDVREPALDARRPRRARRTSPSRRRRTWRRSCASCDRWCATRGRRSRDLRELIRKPGAEQRPDRADRQAAAARAADLDGLPAHDPRAEPRPAGGRVRCASTRPISPAGSRSSARAPRTTTRTATSRASQPIFSGFSFTDTPAGGVLTPVEPASRLAGFDFNNLKRCPGGGTQQSPDGSSNWPVEDCDPSSAPGSGP